MNQNIESKIIAIFVISRITFNYNLYYPELINQKRVLLKQYNAPAHKSKVFQKKLADLEGIDIFVASHIQPGPCAIGVLFIPFNGSFSLWMAFL